MISKGKALLWVWVDEGSVFTVRRWIMDATLSVYLRGPPAVVVYVQRAKTGSLSISARLLWPPGWKRSSCGATGPRQENGASNSRSHLQMRLLGFGASCYSAKIEIGTGSKHEMGSGDLPLMHTHTHTGSHTHVWHMHPHRTWIWGSSI